MGIDLLEEIEYPGCQLPQVIVATLEGEAPKLDLKIPDVHIQLWLDHAKDKTRKDDATTYIAVDAFLLVVQGLLLGQKICVEANGNMIIDYDVKNGGEGLKEHLAVIC